MQRDKARLQAAIAQALEGISERDRMATRRVLEQLAVHLEPTAAPGLARRSRERSRASKERSDSL